VKLLDEATLGFTLVSSLFLIFVGAFFYLLIVAKQSIIELNSTLLITILSNPKLLIIFVSLMVKVTFS
jgi:hypothetical protein